MVNIARNNHATAVMPGQRGMPTRSPGAQTSLCSFDSYATPNHVEVLAAAHAGRDQSILTGAP